MKKVCLLALLCFCIIQLRAQDGVVFKIKYLPNHTYKSDISIGMKINANVTGDPDILDKLKASGITPPVVVDVEMGLTGSMQTGAPGADKSFPLNIDYKITKLSVSANGQEAPIPPSISEKDIRVAAHIGQDGIMVIDSADGKAANDSTKKKSQQMMSFFQKQIQFPDKPMKPGDTFTQTVPVNVPAGKGGNNINVSFSTTYKLTSISDGKAYFDVVPNLSMTLTLKNMSINMSGTGTGKMVYSIKDNYAISHDGNFDMKVKMTSAKVNVDGNATVTATSTTVVN